MMKLVKSGTTLILVTLMVYFAQCQKSQKYPRPAVMRTRIIKRLVTSPDDGMNFDILREDFDFNGHNQQTAEGGWKEAPEYLPNSDGEIWAENFKDIIWFLTKGSGKTNQ